MRALPLLLTLAALLAWGAVEAAQWREWVPAELEEMRSERRVALVIGNGRYRYVRNLRNAVADAELMADTLEDMGFEVRLETNLRYAELANAIADFEATRAEGGVALFYYAGHGVQLDGQNFLIPVDADIPDERYVRGSAVNLVEVLKSMAGAGSRLNLVVLDACRQNPFESKWFANGRDQPVLSGLSSVSGVPSGFFLAFATSPGEVASDGEEREHSPYTEALVEAMQVPGLGLMSVFQEVHARVDQATSGQQLPWVSFGIGPGDFFFALPEAPPPLRLEYSSMPPGSLRVGALFGGELALDGQPVGALAPGEELHLSEVPSGRHSLTLGEQTVSVVVEPGETALMIFRPPPGETQRSWRGLSGYEMVWVDPGSATLGSPPDEPGRRPDEGQRAVTLERGFWLGEVEVTQDLWRQVTGEAPWAARFGELSLEGGGLPAHGLSWYDAVAFANRLSERDGLTPAYYEDRRYRRVYRGGEEVYWRADADGYRLPTEAEWEYAARAGGRHRLFAGTDDLLEVCRYANVADASARELGWGWGFGCSDGAAGLAPAGSYEANAWGLYDMTGSVWEWTWDGYLEAPGLATEPARPRPGDYRVLRGGAWTFGPEGARLARRSPAAPETTGEQIGVRLARSL